MLHKSSRPGNHSQRDFILLQLQHGDERGVVHSHRAGAVHCHDLVAAPAQIKRGQLRWRLSRASGWRCDAGVGYDVLQASVEVRRRARDYGFDEERLLAVALLVSPHNAEAPAVVVGLLQDDVPAPVEVTGQGGQGQMTSRVKNKAALSRVEEVVPR